MPFTLLGPDTFRTMPWKDGGGVTTELAIDPPGATVTGPFRWRLSMAKVERSGPFSCFPGMDRSLAVIEGAMEVEVDGARHRLALGSEVLRFPGDAPASGTVTEGPVLDFNLISDRSRVRHRLERLRIGPGTVVLDEGRLRLLFPPDGPLQVEGWGRLDARELLRVDGDVSVRLGSEAPVEVFAVWIKEAPQD